MPPDFDDEELQYLLYLTYCYPGDTTAELLAETFNFWFDRDLDASTIREFVRRHSEGLSEGMASSDGRLKDWPVIIWGRDGSYHEGSHVRLRSLAMYRMMHDLALLFSGVAYPGGYDLTPKETLQEFMKPRLFDCTLFQHLSPLDLIRIYRAKETKLKDNMQGMRDFLSDLHDQAPTMSGDDEAQRMATPEDDVQAPLINLDSNESAQILRAEKRQLVDLDDMGDSLEALFEEQPIVSGEEKTGRKRDLNDMQSPLTDFETDEPTENERGERHETNLGDVEESMGAFHEDRIFLSNELEKTGRKRSLEEMQAPFINLTSNEFAENDGREQTKKRQKRNLGEVEESLGVVYHEKPTMSRGQKRGSVLMTKKGRLLY
ncbi:MAG: hypothetical protein Q9168_006455 [Polycauliona sp. 1 TL-2023]